MGEDQKVCVLRRSVVAICIVSSPVGPWLRTAGALSRVSIRRPPPGQARTLMRAHAVKRRSWLGLLHGELAFRVGRIDGWFAL